MEMQVSAYSRDDETVCTELSIQDFYRFSLFMHGSRTQDTHGKFVESHLI